MHLRAAGVDEDAEEEAKGFPPSVGDWGLYPPLADLLEALLLDLEILPLTEFLMEPKKLFRLLSAISGGALLGWRDRPRYEEERRLGKKLEVWLLG